MFTKVLGFAPFLQLLWVRTLSVFQNIHNMRRKYSIYLFTVICLIKLVSVDGVVSTCDYLFFYSFKSMKSPQQKPLRNIFVPLSIQNLFSLQISCSSNSDCGHNQCCRKTYSIFQFAQNYYCFDKLKVGEDCEPNGISGLWYNDHVCGCTSGLVCKNYFAGGIFQDEKAICTEPTGR